MTVEELQQLEIIDEKKLEDMIYVIRGQKVMLDFELAKLYGYETKVFNQQVKNNINKFPPDFRFQISKAESEYFEGSKNLTSRIWVDGNKGGRSYLPYAFTEQGIYMLMTVLKGEIATEQSIRIIRVFKTMKDIITESSNLITTGELLKLSNQVNDNSNRISKLENKNKYMNTQLKVVMDNFKDPTKYKEIILFGNERIEADELYEEIYVKAKHSIIIVDDYISNKTLIRLKKCPLGVDITIYSDNAANKNERIVDINTALLDFTTDTGNSIVIKPTNNKVHDRLIFIDYDTKNEKVYLCGPSSKDAGSKISSIIEINNTHSFHEIIDELK